jgi:hypothetical protein
MIVALLATFSHGLAQQTADSISWVPPVPRHLKAPFAPKPHAGNNIF